jgi:hypothetical protein
MEVSLLAHRRGFCCEERGGLPLYGIFEKSRSCFGSTLGFSADVRSLTNMQPKTDAQNKRTYYYIYIINVMAEME